MTVIPISDKHFDTMAVPRLGQLVTGLFLWRPRPVPVGFLADQMALGKVLLQVLWLGLSVSFHQSFHTHSFITNSI